MYQCNPQDWNAQVEENKEKMSADEFMHWFDGGESVGGAVLKGQDIFRRLILPVVNGNVKDPGQKSCMEMGYGNGCLTLAASQVFENAYGLDWHDQADAVGQLIEDDFPHGPMYLVHSPDGINMQDDSVDFIYSWLYAQRLGNLENVKAFLTESYRVMKDHGVGLMFFPRYIRTGKAQSVKDYEGDVLAENADQMGYRDGGVTTRVKGISIIVSLWKMKELVEEAGFQIIGQTASYDGKGRGKVYHGQHGLVFRKGDAEPDEVEVPEKKVEEKAQEPAGGEESASQDTQKKSPAKKSTTKKSTKKSRLKKRK